MAKKFYVTTAIDYVNARPHNGHAFEKVIADALVRWIKLRGDKTWFLTGTDENASKNFIAAKDAGVDVKKFVDKNVRVFVDLCEKLNVDYNRFIRTTEDEHVKKSKEIFKKVYEKGDIYKGNYEGYYCSGCEEFKTEKDLVAGKCSEHNKEPDWVSEEAYFFKLSKYKDKILKFVKSYIVPDTRKNEIIRRLESEELKDLSVTRVGLDWGIECPIDKKHKIYVWFDALVNYITGSEGNWPADVHVIGKGINWFHSVIWPGMLFSLGEKMPNKLLVHGYVNLKGKKVSKSLGNVIDPIKLVDKYGSDSVRYSLLRGHVFEDFDYEEDVLIERHNNELANKIGNLISRVFSLAEKNGIEVCENKLLKKLNLGKIEKLFDEFKLHEVLVEILKFVDVCNEYVQSKKPWENKDKKVLYELVDSIKAIGILLWPFIPSAAEKIVDSLGVGLKYENINVPLKEVKIKKEGVLFEKIRK